MAEHICNCKCPVCGSDAEIQKGKRRYLVKCPKHGTFTYQNREGQAELKALAEGIISEKETETVQKQETKLSEIEHQPESVPAGVVQKARRKFTWGNKGASV